MPDILTLISDADRIAFSQNFTIQRPSFLGDRLFPDVKTENLAAEYLRLANGSTIPTMATVHAFDTEAEIGSRPAFDKTSVEKLLIKRKINQSERMRQLVNHGVNKDDAIVRYVFDDMRLMADAVKVRTEAAKMEVLATGKMAIKENGLNLTVDYGVPTGNTNAEINTSGSTGIVDQIQNVVDKATSNGYVVTEMVTSTKVLRKMAADKGIQTLIYGTAGQGTYVSQAKLAELFANMFDIGKITVNDGQYKYQKANGSFASARFFPEDKISFICATASQFGVGLWGVTPEEEEYGQYSNKSANQYITITQWADKDPVAVWTKASGLFIPVLPDPNALYVATVK